jgi:hypothetical protein
VDGKERPSSARAAVVSDFGGVSLAAARKITVT